MIKINGMVIDDSNTFESVIMRGNDIFVNGKKFDMKEQANNDDNTNLNINVIISDCTIEKLNCRDAEVHMCKIQNLNCDDCKMEGNISGPVTCDDLTIKGFIHGNVKADVVNTESIFGYVKANVINK